MFKTLTLLSSLIDKKFHIPIVLVIILSVLISMLDIAIIVIAADCINLLYNNPRTLGFFSKEQEIIIGGITVLLNFLLWRDLHRRTAFLGWSIGNFFTKLLIAESFKKYDNRSNFNEDEILNLSIVECMRLTHAVIVPFIIMCSRAITVIFLVIPISILFGPKIFFLIGLVLFFAIAYRTFTIKKLSDLGDKITLHGLGRVSAINMLIKNKRELLLYEADHRAMQILQSECDAITKNQTATFQISNSAKNFIEAAIIISFFLILLSGYSSFIDAVTIIAFLKVAPNFYQAAQLHNTAYANIGSAKKIIDFFNFLASQRDRGSKFEKKKNEYLVFLPELTWRIDATGISAPEIKIEEGDSILITGPSGSGKSALLDIIVGLRDPCANYFYRQDELKFSIASQMPSFIEGSVRDNIEFFCPNYDKEELHRLSGKLFINHLQLLEKNIRVLSVGELARVSVLRSLLRTADIFIFDEVNASLDKENAARIINTITEELINKTKIFIMHKDTELVGFDKHYKLVDRGQK